MSPILLLFILALPIACISWTINHEELFREFNDYCQDKHLHGNHFITRKFFFLFTCEYCFSHYVAILFMIFAKFQLGYSDWRGYVIGFFAIVWIANVYMGLYQIMRLKIKEEKNSGTSVSKYKNCSSKKPLL